MLNKHIPFHKSLNGRLLAALVLVALVSVGGLGFAAYLNERAALEAQVAAQLTSVADLKKEQIITWLDERQADVRLLAVNNLNQEHFTELFSPEIPFERKIEFAAFVTDNLIGMQQSRSGYNEITFVDASGTVILSTEPTLVGQPTQHKVVFAETLAAPAGTFIQDIHFDPHTGLIEMEFGHIINAIDLDTGEETSEVIGVALITVNMDETIYPLIRAWPGMGNTGETLLVRAEDGDTLFLNNLRFDDNAALNLRIPADSLDAKPAHYSARGNRGIIQTPDYRGVPVLAAYRHIPGIGWGFVAKEDLDEAFAPVNVLAFRIGLVAAAILLAAGLLSVVISRTLTRPLTQLVEGTRTVAAGDLMTEIDVIREDEIGTLAGSFNQMTIQLRQTLEGLERHVAELKRTQTALRESEEKFRALLESASEGIIVINSDGDIELVNAQIELIFGYSRAELLGQSIEILLPQHFRAAHVKHRADYHAKPHTRPMGTGLNLVGRRKNGSEFPVEVGLSFIETGAGKLVMGFIMDITGRRRADEALRKSEVQFRELYQGAPYAYFSIGVDGYIKMANRRAEELLGYPLDDLIGRPVLDLYADTPAGKERAQALFQRFLAGEEILEEEMEMCRVDGTTVSVQLTARLIKDSAGQVVSSRSMVVDITARKKLEEQLRQAQKLESIGQLAGGVAHDFNNLLTVIIGHSALLLSQIKDTNLREDVKQIEKAGERAASLTRQLLAFSRKQVLQPKILDLNGIVSDLERMLRRLIGEDIELVTVLGLGMDRVKADPGQIEQVILNLVLNARDAMPLGGKLIIETANGNLDEAYARQPIGVESSPYVMLTVSDTGVGMDERTLAHIYEPFFTTKGREKGTGLGLATVYGIVKQSDGHIRVYSEPGQGTTFKVYLPRIEEPLGVSDVSSVRIKPLRGSETILLVEDEAQVRALACKILQENGYAVLEARHGEEALQVCQQNEDSIHLLLTDVVMPGGISGRELAERLVPLRPEMKVLYMSGYTDNAIVHHGILDSDIAFIQKPFDPSALVHKVRAVLDG